MPRPATRRPAPAEVAEALALVHRPAASGDRAERLAGDRVVAADLDPHRAAPPPPPPPRPNPPPFWRIRFGCQAVSSPSCSGNALGSPASLNASTARMADAVWCPWPPPWGEKRVMITSGRNVRMTRTISATTCVPVPDPQGLGGALREAEVDGAGEELPAAVEPAGGEQLLGPDHPQLFEELGADHVLPAVAPREREIGRAVVAAAREVGDQLGVLVVGMGGHVEHAPQLAKPAQLPQGVLGRHRLRGAAAGDRPGQAGPRPGRRQRAEATGRFDPWERRGADMARPRSWEVHRGRTVRAAMEVRRRRAAVRPYFFTVNGTEYWVFSHIILSTPPPPVSDSIAIVNWSTVLSRVRLLEVHPRQLVGLLRFFVVGDAPLAGLLVDDELGGAVLVGDGEQRVRAGGERVAADLDRLLGRQQGRLVGARAPDLAVGDQPAPDLADLGRSRASWCRGARRRASSRRRRSFAVIVSCGLTR